MDNIFELNTVNNVKDEVGASKVKSTSPVVEVFSALVQGKSLSSLMVRSLISQLSISRILLVVLLTAITRLFLS